MRDIGAAGESFFKGWCSAAGITANQSMSDAHGWDVLIEMDISETHENPLLVHEGMIESKIQIKSTDSGKKYVDVELSNLRKMSTSLLPTFYVLIDFQKEEFPARAYLRHVDQPLINQVLKRISELKAKNPKAKLNKSTLRVHFTDEITPLTPGTLRSLIGKYIGSSQSRYVEKKRIYLDSAGFEEDAYSVKFSIPNLEQLDRFIDASLGQSVGVEVENLAGSVTRFGLSNPLPQLSASTAVLSIMQVSPDGHGKIKFRKKSTGTTYSFPADMYRGSVNSLLPLVRRKLRIDAKYFDIILQTENAQKDRFLNSMNVKMTLESTTAAEIEDILKTFKAFQLLRDGGNEMEIDFFGVQAKFDLDATGPFDDCTYQINKLTKIVELKRHFEWSDPLMLSLEQIESQIETLDRYHPLIVNAAGNALLLYQSGDGPPQGVKADCAYIVGVILGDHLFIEVLVITGTVEAAENDREKIVGVIKQRIYKTVVERNCDRLELRKNLEFAISSYQSDLPIMNFGPVFYKDMLGIPYDPTHYSALNVNQG